MDREEGMTQEERTQKIPPGKDQSLFGKLQANATAMKKHASNIIWYRFTTLFLRIGSLISYPVLGCIALVVSIVFFMISFLIRVAIAGLPIAGIIVGIIYWDNQKNCPSTSNLSLGLVIYGMSFYAFNRHTVFIGFRKLVTPDLKDSKDPVWFRIFSCTILVLSFAYLYAAVLALNSHEDYNEGVLAANYCHQDLFNVCYWITWSPYIFILDNYIFHEVSIYCFAVAVATAVHIAETL